MPKENQHDTLSGGIERDFMESVNMTLIVVVSSCLNTDLLAQVEKNDEIEADPFVDMSGLMKPTLVSQYFPKQQASATATPSAAAAQPEPPSISKEQGSGNLKKRKRDSDDDVQVLN